MTIWITVTEPITANFYGSAAVMAKAFPSGFITLYSVVFHRFYNFKKSELLSGQIMCELKMSTQVQSNLPNISERRCRERTIFQRVLS